ncbi:MAG: histidine kinase [Candidatus Raymondbacteria bacterium RifOxyA12_full_50_37]|uniref:Histidine kinase n=1 Tax=Candidatus Raymondbacteria bacterium RIFOXYD12_FULL_49_13 TaxID=1817890 RepID=A0A1F7F3T6_UNCRA|nr:MAG: histidine kinase [Candidatus Raymondbacteria bacterium RifOxyA12_full_50_37]OGJ90356.1 MAG: histidine kinase [Candidatus Raymondbacteria bacterium RIFOXYA2_FULL_49_16]OGK01309.1 MAG: histidine kinase [Candidatus Raymondbacteria bacterium RIFOXYD12_FULL_49_13]OGP43255.1 MAG: histidine kinase [Candidatus Raymondbacteria bacterium RIFOXYB2_FULL_49_35]
MKILSADDSGMIRRVIKSTVESMGHELLEARDGQEALEVLEARGRDIGLILLDWNMPRLDGLSLLKKIQVDSRLNTIPVIMVTTEVERNKVVEAIKAGAKNYVMKPFSQADLVSKINETLGMG